jgi:hypothetical protein
MMLCCIVRECYYVTKDSYVEEQYLQKILVYLIERCLIFYVLDIFIFHCRKRQNEQVLSVLLG